MKIVFDTNVLVSAFITRGSSYEVFKHCLSSHHIFFSTHIENEVEHVLGEKLSLPENTVKEILSYLDNQLERIETLPLEVAICEDPADDMILSCARSAEADCLITGDSDLLVLEEYRGTAIMKPSSFWKFEKQRTIE